MFFAKPIVGAFTSKKEVQEKALDVLPWFCAAIFPDLWQGFIQGVIKALGIQEKVAVINLIGYWVLNMPLCWLFAFHFKFGFKGIWMAMLIS
jgi:MATE family multidrug resistance protein